MVSKEEEMLKERIRHLLTMKRVSVASLADNDGLSASDIDELEQLLKELKGK